MQQELFSSKLMISDSTANELTISNGGRIALGSDFPVESINPLKGFFAAVTRLSESGTSPHGPEGWYANMKLTREEALRGMTVDGKCSCSERKEVS
jgi:predicted amidohydrolase YtcJ